MEKEKNLKGAFLHLPSKEVERVLSEFQASISNFTLIPLLRITVYVHIYR